MLNESNPSAPVLSLKSFETFEKVADGKATKIIIPSELQNTAGTIAAIAETIRKQ